MENFKIRQTGFTSDNNETKENDKERKKKDRETQSERNTYVKSMVRINIVTKPI